jgi:predicted aspartyl protease
MCLPCVFHDLSRILRQLMRRMGIASALLLWSIGGALAQGHSGLPRRLLTTRVEVNKVNGLFLVDTGSNCTIIDSAFARRLGLKPSGTALVERNYSTEEHAMATADNVRIGAKSWSSVPLVVLDLTVLSKMGAATILGVLGTDLLAKMRMRVSYSSGNGEVVDDIEQGGLPVALQKGGSRYFVPVIVGTSRLEMLLDTGTNLTALSSTAWQSLPFSSGANQTIEGIQSSGGPARTLLACIASLQVGDTPLHNLPIRVISSLTSGSFADPTFAGILGGDVLEHFELTLDLGHSVIYLKRDAGFRADPYEFVTIGIQFFKSGDFFSVVAVWKDSPAEAVGVLVGDRILSINGRSSAALGVEEFAKKLHGAAGTPIEMEVERPSGTSTFRMKTRQLVCGSEAAIP